MTKDLAVFGSSFAAGYSQFYNPQLDYDREDKENAWPQLLANKLGIAVSNYARSGSSNSRVYRTAFDKILNPDNSIYIVELGPYSWYEIASSVTGKIEQIHTPYNNSKLNTIILKEYYNNYFFYTNLLRQIVSLQALGETKSVELYFLDSTAHMLRELTYETFVNDIIGMNSKLFNALDDEMLLERFNITKNINDQINYKKFFLTQPSYTILKENNLLDQTNHPTVEGHKLISEMLYQEILNNKCS